MKRTMQLMPMLILMCLLASAQAGIDPGLLARANGGDAAAQVQVGEAYAEGKGVARDARQAVEWYTKAADTGNMSAELHLAVLYREKHNTVRQRK